MFICDHPNATGVAVFPSFPPFFPPPQSRLGRLTGDLFWKRSSDNDAANYFNQADLNVAFIPHADIKRNSLLITAYFVAQITP